MSEINIVKIFKALSCEQRFYLFKVLYEWCETAEEKDGDYVNTEGIDKCFTKACCCINLSKSTISHHFKELQNAGLISYSRNGQSFCCKINREAIDLIRNFLDNK
jgi:ArsR family transcriptional regulator